MKIVYVRFESADSVKDFVNIINKYSFDVDLSSDRYVVDGKSFLGALTLDLSKPVKVEIHTDDPSELCKEIEKFIITENI